MKAVMITSTTPTHSPASLCVRPRSFTYPEIELVHHRSETHVELTAEAIAEIHRYCDEKLSGRRMLCRWKYLRTRGIIGCIFFDVTDSCTRIDTTRITIAKMSSVFRGTSLLGVRTVMTVGFGRKGITVVSALELASAPTS